MTSRAWLARQLLAIRIEALGDAQQSGENGIEFLVPSADRPGSQALFLYQRGQDHSGRSVGYFSNYPGCNLDTTALTTTAPARFSDELYTTDRGMIRFCPGGTDRANPANWQTVLFGYDRDPKRQLQMPEFLTPTAGSCWIAFSYRTARGDGLAVVHRDNHELRVLRPAQAGRLTDLAWEGQPTIRYRHQIAGRTASGATSLAGPSRPDPSITWLIKRHHAVREAIAVLSEIRQQPTVAARRQRFDHYTCQGLCSLARREYQALIDAPGPLLVDLQEFGRNAAGSEVAILVISVDNRRRVGQPPDGSWYYLRWNLRRRKLEQAVSYMGEQPHAGHTGDGEASGQELSHL